MEGPSFRADVDLASVAGRRAVSALWWICHEVGDERVLEIERESFATTADLGERAKLLLLRMMEWARVGLDQTRRDLLGLLQAGFQESPVAEELETQKQRIVEACRRFVWDTHSEESADQLRESAEALYLIALTAIPLRELPLATIAFGILRKRRERRPPEADWSRFTASLDRLGLSRTSARQSSKSLMRLAVDKRNLIGLKNYSHVFLRPRRAIGENFLTGGAACEARSCRSSRECFVS
jgi:hypothetical protein